MTTRIRFTPDPNSLTGLLTEVPIFPDDVFHLNAPEAIGDASQVVLASGIAPNWTSLPGGAWQATCQQPGELDFTMTVTPGIDTFDIEICLTNQSTRIWANSLAFTCFNCREAPSIADYDCARHWARCNGQFKRLIEVRRRFSPRPTVQAYSVEGATPATLLPFIAAFQATPDAALEGWLAIRTEYGSRLVAAVSKPASFLFQNMEYSCIHSGPSFGTLNPGQMGQAWTRLYLTRDDLDSWYLRMKAEMGL